MSVPSEKRQGSLFAVPVLAAALFENAADRYRLFRDKVLPCLRAVREQLAALYCADNGRPAIEPVVALGVTLLQFMEKVPDRKAEENLRLHLGWKYALDVELGYAGFDHSSLGQFRDRLLAGGVARIGFDALLQGLRAAGLVRRRGKQRLDSTHVLGAVAKMGRLEVMRETMRLVLRFVYRRGAPHEVDRWALLYERYVDSQIAWHRLNAAGLTEKFAQAGEDALGLIKWLRRQPAELRDSDQAVLLQRVFLEQYELGGSGVPQRRATEASGVVQNPHDPEVQWATKDLAKTTQWEGYKVQIAETVAADGQPKPTGEPTEQFLTEVTTTEAIASDLDGRRRLEQHQEASGQGVADELYVDAAYVTDDTLAEAQAQGRELLGPPRPSANAAGAHLFAADAFDVDITNRKAICAAGHESRQCSRLENHRTGQVDYRFEWAALCETCPLQKRCTTSRSGRRMLVVGQHHDLLQERRRAMQHQEFQRRLQQRNAIEGTISEFTRGGGRRTRYRGLAKTTLANYFAGAAVNARRWIRLLQWRQEQELTEQAV